MKKWITTYTPLYFSADKHSNRLLYIPAGVVVLSTQEIADKPDGLFERVILTGDNNYVGWVETKYLEPYFEGYPINCVDIKAIQTPNPADAEQYIFWKKVKQVNLCGELCVSYLLNISLEEMLINWEVKTPSFFNRIFNNGIARGTGEEEIIEMFNIFNQETIKLSNYLKVYTPAALQAASEYGLIAGCKIDKFTGRLRGQGAGHWVVITNVTQERTGYGLVQIYNPFSNRIEIYSWAEFIASARTPYGALKLQNI